MSIINWSLQHKRDTAANWLANNPVLLNGQMGIDTTNKIVKLGDGVTAWNSLTSSIIFRPGDQIKASGTDGGHVVLDYNEVFMANDDSDDNYFWVNNSYSEIAHVAAVYLNSPLTEATGNFTTYGNIKIGSPTYIALNKLDVDGNISVSTNGVNVFRVLKDVAAAGYSGPGFYSASDIGYGVHSGGQHIFIGVDGNTEIGRFDDVGGFRIGSAGQSFVTPFVNFRKDVDDATLFRVENQNSGNAARAMIVVQGEPTTSPATHARYGAISVTSSTFGGGSIIGSIVPPNTFFIQSGGNLIGGWFGYADDGPIQLANNIHYGVAPAFYISPYSLNGSVVSGQFGKIGIHNSNPNAFLDLPGANAYAASLLIGQSSVVPSGGSHANGAIWRDATDLYLVKDGTENIFLVTTSVNSISPTAPNRTISITFGGTTYYIHAKTTND